MLITAFAVATTTAAISFNATAKEQTVPVSGCRYTGVESDRCLATDGTNNYEITNCANNTTAASCGISVPTPSDEPQS
ncbi:hypothetical protein [Pedobacter nutrimenti]|nr:hypothetical protein [Pedobacter nutrimenti]